MVTHVESRQVISHTPDWSAGVWAGLIAGLVFLVLELALVPVFMGMSPWAPVRMIAAIIMGQGVLPPPDTFDLGIFLAAGAVHFGLSIVLGLILAGIFTWLHLDSSAWLSLLAGAVFGLVVYFVNFYGMTSFFPWFADARNWLSITVHAIFGIVAALAYKKMRA
ncbi:MAG: hypothetical protein ACREV2_10995 [Burkholderiales bacterium]